MCVCVHTGSLVMCYLLIVHAIVSEGVIAALSPRWPKAGNPTADHMICTKRHLPLRANTLPIWLSVADISDKDVVSTYIQFVAI